jgi:hypothetical protein
MMLVGLYFNDISNETQRGRIEGGNYDLPKACPNCGAENSVIGNGRRLRWCIGSNSAKIAVRRGKCKSCHKTFTFLPTFARPYSRYSISVIQDTLLSFFSNAESTLFESVPDILNESSTPDFKTLYNWLHDISDRIPVSSFNFRSGCGLNSFPLFSEDIAAKKVCSASDSLFGKLYAWLSGIKKHFDKGSSFCFQGLRFHAGNFLQALFTVEKVLAWRLP